MHPIQRFTLARHAGPYESWPRLTQVLDRGAPTKLALPAYQLLHQFELPGGFLLVLDDDCPSEEITTFCLLSRDLRLLSRRWLGLPYASFMLRAIDWIDERRFVADFGQAENPKACALPNGARVRYGFRVRSRGIPYLWPRLALRDPAHWPPARARFETKSP